LAAGVPMPLEMDAESGSELESEHATSANNPGTSQASFDMALR